jgi:hypothetical protein
MSARTPDAIASRVWLPHLPLFYVSELPGEGGIDWGYTTDASKARLLSAYWQRRFAADCRRCNAEARFTRATEGGN